MKLLVLGASGATGSWFVRLAAQAGHDVTAVVRPSAQLTAPTNVRVVRGDVLDTAFLASAMNGHEAIVSCLGIRRGGKVPWSSLKSPPDLMTRVAAGLVSTMPHGGI